MNKLLALSKVQSRLVAEGGKAGMNMSLVLAKESAPVGEFIGQEKYEEACQLASKLETKYGLNLAGEQRSMVTVR